jgi:superfamily I DNA/RNA helicase
MQRLLGASQERHRSVFAAMKDPPVQTAFVARTRASLASFVETVEQARARLQQPGAVNDPQALQHWAEDLLTRVGYFDDLRRSEKDPETAENRVRNLKELIASLDGAGAPGTAPVARLERFLEDITLDTQREEDEENHGDVVTLITMHSCKGLEFPHVFIVGLEEGLLPHARSKVEGTMDEERRLFYVAITRAMRTLKISHCAARRKYGQLTPCHPSRFLQELPKELVELATEREDLPMTPEQRKEWFAAMRATFE